MTRLICALTLSMAAAAAASDALPPGFVDLDGLSGTVDAQTVVDLRIEGWLLQLARLATADEPEGEFLSGIESIRVRVFEVDDEPAHADVRRQARRLTHELRRGGWEEVTTIRGRDEFVSVLLLGDQEQLHGLTVVAMEGAGEAVFVNIAGRLRAADLARLLDDHVSIAGDIDVSWGE